MNSQAIRPSDLNQARLTKHMVPVNRYWCDAVMQSLLPSLQYSKLSVPACTGNRWRSFFYKCCMTASAPGLLLQSRRGREREKEKERKKEGKCRRGVRKVRESHWVVCGKEWHCRVEGSRIRQMLSSFSITSKRDTAVTLP